MTELVNRYVHQVGRYLPQKERAEIEAELRSQIQDELEDRYAGSPTQEQIASVLTELGDPRKMAQSYMGEQYLVGPELYPYLMGVLRHGWLYVPAIVVFLNVFGALASSEPTTLIGLLIGTVIGAAQATLIFTAVAVLIFAMIQHSDLDLDDLDEEKAEFDPLDLPEVNDPSSVDRLEASIGMAFGLFLGLLFVYFLRVGGLTLRFNLSDPGDVIPIPEHWMATLIFAVFAQVALNLLVLRRNRWNIGLVLTETALELLGTVGLYFAVFDPLAERIFTSNPSLTNIPFAESAPEIIAIVMAVPLLISQGGKLIKMWGYKNTAAAPLITQNDGGSV